MRSNMQQINRFKKKEGFSKNRRSKRAISKAVI